MIATIGLEALSADGGLSVSVGDGTTLEWTRVALLDILGYGVVAGIVALVGAFGHRAMTVRKLPAGPAVLVGLALPASWLTTVAIRHDAVIADAPLTHYTSGTFLFGVLTTGTIAAVGGHRLGDRLACGSYEIRRFDATGSGNVTELLQSAGLAVAVTLPSSIDDAEGYPVVDESVSRMLEGQRFLLPSGLSLAARRTRIEGRIETDFDVGYVRVELAADGALSSVSVGGKRSGISPTLGPDQVAVAIAGNLSANASAGDPIDVWTDEGDSSQLVATGTLRSSSGSVVTLLVDGDDSNAFEPRKRYRLTTRPETPPDWHALVAAIRGAAETVVAIEVDADGPLESEFVGWIPGTVLLLERNGEEEALPAESEALQAGDTAYVLATPAELESLSSMTPS